MEKINFVNGTQPAINATNLNKLQTNSENAIKEVTPKSTKMTISEDTAKGANVTLSKKYKVGAGVLDVYLNGERLIKSSDEAGTDGHYTEVGTAGATSNQIKLTTDWNLSSGDYLEIIVRGEYV